MRGSTVERFVEANCSTRIPIVLEISVIRTLAVTIIAAKTRIGDRGGIQHSQQNCSSVPSIPLLVGGIFSKITLVNVRFCISSLSRTSISPAKDEDRAAARGATSGEGAWIVVSLIPPEYALGDKHMEC